MSENPADVRRPSFRFGTPATFVILALNVVVYVYEHVHLKGHRQLDFEFQYALSLHGLRAHHYWQILSYQFLHANELHIIANSFAIYFFGRAIEFAIGWWRMVLLYFAGGIVGGLLQIAWFWIWPSYFEDSGVVGASAGAFGLVAAFSVLFPRERLLMLLFFIIPLAMRARTLLGISIALALIGMALPFWTSFNDRFPQLSSFYNNIGHTAHLGGILTGCLGALLIRRQYRAHPVAN